MNLMRDVSEEIYETLDHAYCDNCRHSYGGDYRDCEECHREENQWQISVETTSRLVSRIMELVAKKLKEG